MAYELRVARGGYIYWEDANTSRYYTVGPLDLLFISLPGPYIDAYLVAIDSFVDAAEANLQAQIDDTPNVYDVHDWAATGETYTGTAMPVPNTTDVTDPISIGSVCGADGYSRVYISGAYMGIKTFLYGAGWEADLRTQTRWVEDLPYKPVGTYNRQAPSFPIHQQHPSWTLGDYILANSNSYYLPPQATAFSTIQALGASLVNNTYTSGELNALYKITSVSVFYAGGLAIQMNLSSELQGSNGLGMWGIVRYSAGFNGCNAGFDPGCTLWTSWYNDWNNFINNNADEIIDNTGWFHVIAGVTETFAQIQSYVMANVPCTWSGAGFGRGNGLVTYSTGGIYFGGVIQGLTAIQWQPSGVEQLGVWHKDNKITIENGEIVPDVLSCRDVLWIYSPTQYYEAWIADLDGEPEPEPPVEPRKKRWIVEYRTTCRTSNNVVRSIDITNELVIERELPSEYRIRGGGGRFPGYSYTYPGYYYNITQGVPYNGYQNFEGFYCLDLHLKKWGKGKQQFVNMIDFYPTNVYNPASYTATDKGITGGIKLSTGEVFMWDNEPADSWIRYGKIGYYRLGMCHFLESRIDFRKPATGNITLDFSINGRGIEVEWQQEYVVTEDYGIVIFPNQRARWMTITISGKYDLSYMETRANISGRR